ncbi:tetratricopeptide repeat protein [candidate division CSSED10-310 bacterium]|uniref:Tetratricopeptide repeat protein n=1 Tax=candidate division CSSED10-310 bacterium TaxID=2855610 RepID=A0ABV6Z3T8_UNCC1
MITEEGQTATISPAQMSVTQSEAREQNAADMNSVSGQEKSHDDQSVLSREELRFILNIFHGLCFSLAYLHGEGIVHRDLKPENVLVNENGMPVIVDFGLYHQYGGSMSRETLEVEGWARGTAAYMAPEQIRGELVDARADIYALGCMLYEFLTRRQVFTGKSIRAVLRQHLEVDPTPPSLLSRGIPTALEDLVQNMLHKDPIKRIGYATDVSQALTSLGAEHDQNYEKTVTRTYVYRPHLTGRFEELKILHTSLEKLHHGQGALVLIGGESGVGKTRLTMELSREAVGFQFDIFTGQCQDHLGGSLLAFHNMLQSLADRCRETGLKLTEQLFGKRGKVLSLYESSIAELPGQEKYREPAPLSLEPARVRLFMYLQELLTELSSQNPVLLVVDDLQWIDELSLGFLLHLMNSNFLEHHPILILGTYRSDEVNKGLNRLLQITGIEKLSVSRLPEDAVATIVADMLALSPPPRQFSHFLFQHSEGNPFFVAEYINTAVIEGILWRNDEGQWQVGSTADEEGTERDYENLPLPKTIRELVLNHVMALPGDCRAFSQAASIIGRDVSMPLLSRMTGCEEQQFTASVHELVNRQIIELTTPDTFRFVHDKIRKVILEKIAKKKRRVLHRRAAQAFENVYAPGLKEHSAILGFHWEQAGLKKKARHYYLIAANKFIKQSDYVEAEKLFQSYLSLSAKVTPEVVKTRTVLAIRIFANLGRTKEALPELEWALEQSRRLNLISEQGQCLLGLAWIYYLFGRMSEGFDYCREAISLVPESEPGLEAHAYTTMGLLHYNNRSMSEAEAALNHALVICKALKDVPNQATILGNLGVLKAWHGKYTEAEKLYLQSLEMKRQIVDIRGETLTLINLGNLLTNRGSYETAEKHFNQALSLAHSIGDRRSEAIATGNLADTLVAVGKLDRARSLAEKGLTLKRAIGDKVGEAITENTLGTIYMLLGDPDLSKMHLHSSLEISRSLNDRFWTGISLYDLACLERRIGGNHQVLNRLIEESEACLRGCDDPIKLGHCLCEKGHIRLSQNLSANHIIQEVNQVVQSGRPDPKNELGEKITMLVQAESAFTSGMSQYLFRGELIEKIPAGLRTWLAENGHLITS